MTEKETAAEAEEKPSVVAACGPIALRFAMLIFAMTVGTALVLNVQNDGFTWSNTPWLILCIWFLTRR